LGFNRFVRWPERGVWERLFRELPTRGRSTQTQMIDATHVKARRGATRFAVYAALGELSD
jgi:putative transposase